MNIICIKNGARRPFFIGKMANPAVASFSLTPEKLQGVVNDLFNGGTQGFIKARM